MQWLIFIVIGIIWLFSKASDGISSANISASKKKLLLEERSKKYGDRTVDQSKSLLERNADIIASFENKVKAHSTETSSYRKYRSYPSPTHYYIENLTRDCINDIALAENKFKLLPNAEYLSTWKPKVPKDWQNLATQVEANFRNKQQQLIKEEETAKAQKLAEMFERSEKEKKLRLEQWEKEETIKEIERNVKRYGSEFNRIKTERKDPLLLKKIYKKNGRGELCIEDISLILAPDLHPWSELEAEFISKPYKIKPFPLFSSNSKTEFKLASIFALNNEIAEFNESLGYDIKQGNDVRDFFKNVYKGYKNAEKEGVIERANFVINSVTLPPSVPKIWDADFDPAEGILIVEIKLPDVVHNQIFKEVTLKSGDVKKPITQKELREIVPNFHPAVMLRVAYEIFRNDNENTIKLLVLNGWVEFDNPTTGNTTRTYTASLASTKEQITGLKLSKLDPISAFAGLKGKSAGKLIDIIPVTPMMSLDKKDKRFIETKEVLDKLNSQSNLASMDWQDFENLIAELFQREFSEEGTEIKLTQSSRDKGVDAIVFNPDPIRGGKYVIQAKRYTRTVDVSAVRDLVAVVAHEGASRGILVTTSTFGADAYAFVQNKPITLLDGAKLLGLLEKHNYKFRIDLAEARRLYPSHNNY